MAWLRYHLLKGQATARLELGPAAIKRGLECNARRFIEVIERLDALDQRLVSRWRAHHAPSITADASAGHGNEPRRT